MAEFWWEVNWYRRPTVGEDPFGLWLTARWKPGGPHKGTLGDLIRGHALEVITDCARCDGAVIATPQRDTSGVFASVERGRLVFTVKGREAVHRIFPVLPDTVNFVINVRQTPQASNVPGNIGTTQVVIVNCIPSPHHQCVVPQLIAKRQPDADSAAAENAPRRVYVPVIRFQNATLQKHVRVRVKTLYGKVWKVLSTGSLGGVTLNQAPLGPVLLEALCPRKNSEPTKISGTVFVMISPRVDSAAQLWSDPSVCLR